MQDVRAAVRGAGFTAVEVLDVSCPPRTPGGVWDVVVDGEQLFVGAMGRGSFATYNVTASIEELLGILTEIHSGVPDPVRAELAAVERSGAQLTAAVRESASEGPRPLMLAAGVFVDVIGHVTEHNVFAALTPMAMRSQPPIDLDQYHLFETTGDVETVAGVTGPAFEQPGGGVMLKLAHPVLWYVHRGLFRPVVTE